jgi:hypothetical protein
MRRSSGRISVGAFFSEPKGRPHSVWAKGEEVIVQYIPIPQKQCFPLIEAKIKCSSFLRRIKPGQLQTLLEPRNFLRARPEFS